METCSTPNCCGPVDRKTLCVACYARAYYQANKARIAENARKRFEANPEAAREATRKCMRRRRADPAELARHREQMRERRADPDYRANERIRNNARDRAQPVAKVAREHKRRTRKTAAGGSYTKAEWENILRAYRHTCPGCGATEKKLTVDHVTPIAQGGTSNASNLQPLCVSCNSRKGARTLRYSPWGTQGNPNG